jgi:hypothetical protein
MQSRDHSKSKAAFTAHSSLFVKIFPYLHSLGLDPLCCNITRYYHLPALLYYCSHPSIPFSPSTMLTHIHPQSNLHLTLKFSRIILAALGRLAAHPRLVLGSLIYPTLPVYHPLYSRPALPRTRITCTHIHTLSHISSNVKSHFIMTSPLLTLVWKLKL